MYGVRLYDNVGFDLAGHYPSITPNHRPCRPKQRTLRFGRFEDCVVDLDTVSDRQHADFLGFAAVFV